MNVILTLLYYTVKMSTPLLFVIMGGVFVQRAGVFNFALESAINTGAFAAIAAKAPVLIADSSAKLNTPARWTNTPPIMTNSSGVDIFTV